MASASGGRPLCCRTFSANDAETPRFPLLTRQRQGRTGTVAFGRPAHRLGTLLEKVSLARFDHAVIDHAVDLGETLLDASRRGITIEGFAAAALVTDADVMPDVVAMDVGEQTCAKQDYQRCHQARRRSVQKSPVVRLHGGVS